MMKKTTFIIVILVCIFFISCKEGIVLNNIYKAKHSVTFMTDSSYNANVFCTVNNLNKGDSYDEPNSLPENEDITATFDGWYTKRNGGEKVTTFILNEEKDLVLYPRWKTKLFAINGAVYENDENIKVCSIKQNGSIPIMPAKIVFPSEIEVSEVDEESGEPVTVSYSVDKIKGTIFNNNEYIKHIVIQPPVTTLETRAFYRVTGLETVELPATIKTINTFVFSDTALNKIVYYGIKEMWDTINFPSTSDGVIGNSTVTLRCISGETIEEYTINLSQPTVAL